MCLGIPGKVIELNEEDEPAFRVGKVSFGGSLKDVSFAFVPDARIGDFVIVHAGFVLNTIDEKEAEEVFSYLRQMEEGLSELDEQGS